jgi:hypothetical protein
MDRPKHVDKEIACPHVFKEINFIYFAQWIAFFDTFPCEANSNRVKLVSSLQVFLEPSMSTKCKYSKNDCLTH